MKIQLINKTLRDYIHLLIVAISIVFILLIFNFYSSYKKNELLYFEKVLKNTYLNKTLDTVVENLSPRYQVIKYKVNEGDSLEKILNNFEISNQEKRIILKNILNNKKINKIFENQIISFQIDKKEPIKVVEINFTISKTTNIVFKRDFLKDKFAVIQVEKNLRKDFEYKESVIVNSLYSSAIKEEIPPSLIVEFARSTFKIFDNKIQFHIKKKDGSQIKKGQIIAMIKGDSKNILICERVALNFLSHISGIASYTNKFVKLAKGKSKICCTRKTIPNLRVIQKYAVKLGGGTNHRFNLSDEFLIKDNHIANDNIKEIVSLAIKNKRGKKITVEVDNLKQLKKIIGMKFDVVLFDNMNIKNLKKGVKLAKKYYETEASGNINLKNIKLVAKTGVDRISIGSITHSAPAVDFKLDI